MTNDAIISLQDVMFAYEGDVVALRNLSLTVRKGEFVVVLGANGAGKSTLCYLLSGIVPHIYGGRRLGLVSVAGLDPWDEPLYVTSQRCGVLMQDPEVQLFMPTLWTGTRSRTARGPRWAWSAWRGWRSTIPATYRAGRNSARRWRPCWR